VNLIVYLNEGWHQQWGGSIELWDRQMKHCAAKYPPLLNQALIFNTDENSFHGFPEPLACPENASRKSLALYYYTASKEIYSEVPSTSTMYHARPGDDAAVQREARRLRFDEHLRQWVPPAVLRYARAARRRLGR